MKTNILIISSLILFISSLLYFKYFNNKNKNNFNNIIEKEENIIDFENCKHIGWLQNNKQFDNLLLYLDNSNKYFANELSNNIRIELENFDINQKNIVINGINYSIELPEKIF